MVVQDDGYLINADLSEPGEEGPHGWKARGDFTYDVERRVGRLTYELSGSLVQEVRLPPGHYLLEAELCTDSNEATMFADALDYDLTGTNFTSSSYGLFRIPIGVTEDLKTARLPFFVEGGVPETSVTVGLQAREAGAGLEGQDQEPKRMEIRSVSVTRLGDTALERRWAQHLPVDPIHGLTTLKEAADFDRPGFAIFTDTYTGAELWLISQGRESHLQYPGVSYFSDSGKYVFVSRPGVILRTDGSARLTGYKRERGGVPWLPAWLRSQLPAGDDPDDWIEVETTDEAVALRNVVTRDRMSVQIPTREGWDLALLPAPRSRTLRESGVPNETLVWVSQDESTIGLSPVEGGDLREIPIETDSPDPARDYLFELFWCKGWDGGWYVGYMLNWLPIHNQIRKTPENSINPGQIWALPIAQDDDRGPLRVTGGFEKLQGMRLEDGSVVQRAEGLVGGHKAMDGSLRHRVDAGKVNTMAFENLETGEVTYIGSFPWMEHIEWSQGWAFGSVRGELAPQPLLFFDLEHVALWPIAVMNFHDYGQRLKDYRDGQRLGTERKGYIFWSGQSSSPDGTKVVYASAMLAHSMRDKGDVYIAVARYPQPPVDVRREGRRLVWERPPRHREIRGFHVYRSGRSGGGYARLTAEPAEGLGWDLPGGGEAGYYVLTSVEHSGLESRAFSNEAVSDGDGPVRRFYEAESGELGLPMVPVFDPQDASGGYAAGITDPDLLYKARLEAGMEGTVGLQVQISDGGSHRILGRVRVLENRDPGAFTVNVDGKPVGRIAVENSAWTWVALDSGPVELDAGSLQIGFATGSRGIALDNVMVSNDLDFVPEGKGNTPAVAPTRPENLRIESLVTDDGADPLEQAGYAVAPPYVRFVWDPASAPQGVRHYNVYRGTEPGFVPGPGTLIGSPSGLSFVDLHFTGENHHYRVVAVDNWDNRSKPSGELAVPVTAREENGR